MSRRAPRPAPRAGGCRGGVAVALAVLAAGCSSSPSREKKDPLELTRAVDLDPDPDVVEVELVADVGTWEYLPGKPAEVWGYRDASRSRVTVPGPLIEAKEGDLLVVRVKNDLPESTTVHWHGIRLPQPMDGTNVAQLPIMPGETFDYRFDVDDPGSYWYHPHMMADEQIEAGLYAPLIVRGGVEPAVTADRTFVLDDVKLDADGTLVDEPAALDYMVGRQGNELLVNGARGARLTVKDGARERWRFVNAANGRFFNLEIPGHDFTVIAWDGGLLPEPYEASTVLISPGERYEVLVDLARPSGPGGIALRTLHYDRGHDLPDPGPLDLVSLDFSGTAPAPDPLPTEWGHVEPIAVTGSSAVRSFVLSEEEDGGDGKPRFYINGEAWPFNTPIEADLGATEIWEIENTAEMDHPFHLHGMFFQVLDVDGMPETRLGWKDTVIVPQLSTLRFAVTYTGAGTWMYHCHILEHAELGMMGSLSVE